MDDDESKHDLEMSRSSKADPSAKFKTQKSEAVLDNKRLDSTVSHLNKVIAKEKAKVRELKNLYMKEMGSKS